MSGHWLQDEQRRLTLKAVLASDLGLPEVWLRYFSLTGHADEYELDAYLHGLITLPPMECDIVSHAVNELIDEIPVAPRAPYRDSLRSRQWSE